MWYFQEETLNPATVESKRLKIMEKRGIIVKRVNSERGNNDLNFKRRPSPALVKTR